jgi:hypothetical protein
METGTGVIVNVGPERSTPEPIGEAPLHA